MQKRLKIIFFVATPLVAIMMILVGLLLSATCRTVYITIGSSVMAAWAVLILERLIVGDPFATFYEKVLLFADAAEAGLKRIMLDRNSFFHGQEIISYVQNSRNVKIYGTALGFLIRNKELLQAIEHIALSNGNIEILLAHPDSSIVDYRDKEEKWSGNLRNEIITSLTELFNFKQKSPSTIKLYVFKGEIHNTVISTDRHIIVNPYVFGKKGWVSPAFVFSRTNSSIINDFEGQMNEMSDYNDNQHQDMLMPVETIEQLSSITGVIAERP